MSKLITELEQLISDHEINPQYNIIYDFIQLFLYDKINWKKEEPLLLLKLISLCENFLEKHSTISKGDDHKKTYEFFVRNKATTIPHLKDKLGYDHNVYRLIEDLKKAGLIQRYGKINASKHGGQKPMLWGVPEISKEVLGECVERVYRESQPVYGAVRQVVQLTLREVEEQSIHYSKIVQNAKKVGLGYDFISLADLSAKQLTKQHEIKVWRG
jgi:hypothetical protein